MRGGIYQVVNTENGKRYVGSAVNLKRRWRSHLATARRGQHRNPHLQAAFDKHGEAAFVFSVLEYVEDTAKLLEREQHHLDTLQPDYNIAPVAGSTLGVRPTEEHRRKNSEAQRGRSPITEETRRRLSRAQKGRRHSAEHRRNQSEALTGRHHTAEHRRNNSEAQKRAWARRRERGDTNVGEQHPMYGKHHTEESRQKMSEAQSGEGNSNYGKPMSVEQRRAISESVKRLWANADYRQNMSEASKRSQAR